MEFLISRCFHDISKKFNFFVVIKNEVVLGHKTSLYIKIHINDFLNNFSESLFAFRAYKVYNFKTSKLDFKMGRLKAELSFNIRECSKAVIHMKCNNQKTFSVFFTKINLFLLTWSAPSFLKINISKMKDTSHYSKKIKFFCIIQSNLLHCCAHSVEISMII